MKKSLAVMWTAVALVGLMIVGCNKNDGTGPGDQAPSGVTNEQQALKYYAENDEFVKNDDETYTDNTVDPIEYGTFGKIDASIIPFRFGRFVTSVTRTLTTTIQPGDSVAIVRVDKDIFGTLKILAKVNVTDTAFTLIQKPFHDKSTRNVVFKRFDRDPVRFWLNWLPVATSLVDGGTAPPNDKIDITKVQLFTPGGDTITVTDPNNTYLRYKWLRRLLNGAKDVPEFMGGQAVKLQATVVSASADTDLVALRYGFKGIQKRRTLMTLVSEVNNGGVYTRVYEKTWNAHFHQGLFNAGVDAATKETLFDNDTTKYSVSWWGIPYRVF
jgi:hypothetical protein